MTWEAYERDLDRRIEDLHAQVPLFDVPAASQYAATTPELLAWFKGYNARHPEGERVFPFGFLLSLQAKSRLEMAKDDPEALSHELWRRRGLGARARDRNLAFL